MLVSGQEARADLAVFASWLRAAMVAKELNQIGLAKRIGISHTAVRDWLLAKRPPELPNVIALANTFGVDYNQVIALLPGGATPGVLPATEIPGARSVVLVPVYRQRAAATETGRGSDGVTVTYQQIVPSPGMSKHVFGIEVEGDCMLPALHSGQVIIVDAEGSPAAGRIIVARPNGEWIVKRMARREGSALVLVADNPAFPGEWRVAEHEVVGVVRYSQVDHYNV